MSGKSSGFGRGGIVAQTAATLLSLSMLAFAPPAVGKMILVPLDSASRTALLPQAFAGGARLISPGPFFASLIVYGDHDRLAHAMRRGSVVILAAPFAGCGAA